MVRSEKHRTAQSVEVGHVRGTLLTPTMWWTPQLPQWSGLAKIHASPVPNPGFLHTIRRTLYVIQVTSVGNWRINVGSGLFIRADKLVHRPLKHSPLTAEQ